MQEQENTEKSQLSLNIELSKNAEEFLTLSKVNLEGEFMDFLSETATQICT